LLFDGSRSDLAVATVIAAGKLPVIEAVLDGNVVGRARPMVDKRESVALGAEDVLARAITLIVSLAKAFADGRTLQNEPSSEARSAPARQLLPTYLGSALPRLGREIIRRVRYRHAHWRV